MSLRGCFGCLKFLVFVVNFLFWLLGLAVIAISLWLLFDQQLYLQSIGAQQTDYYVGTYVILGIGVIMTLVGFLGCCGAWKESTWMLGTFFMFLIIILLGEIALGVLIYFKEAPYEDLINRSVQTTVMNKYYNNSSATSQTFDLIQEGLHCCGASGPADWSKSVYNKKFSGYEVPEIGIASSSQPSYQDDLSFGLKDFKIPQSCCKRPETAACRTAIVNVNVQRLPSREIFAQGCSSALTEFVEQHFIYLIAVAGGILVIELIGMIFSLCLCCALRRIEDFKA